MERATKVRAVVFDKTGTLTVGKPTVLEHRVFDRQASSGGFATCRLKPARAACPQVYDLGTGCAGAIACKPWSK